MMQKNMGKIMMNKAFLIIFGSVMFGLGSLLTFGIMSQKNDSLATTTTAIPTNHISLPPTSATTVTNTTSLAPNTIVAQASQNKSFTTQQLSYDQAKQLINTLSDTQLNEYVNKFIPTKDAELITDKRQFANRAVEELYKSNDSQPLQGQILLSNSSQMPLQSMDTSTISKRQKIFAHLNTFGKVPLGTNVFIKWVNRNTGEVLLFEKKLIQPNSDTNWVSYQPYNGWQAGSYDIRFYQFTSQLEPVAQLSYDIQQVVD